MDTDMQKIVEALKRAAKSSHYLGCHERDKEICGCHVGKAREVLPLAQHLSETLPKVREALDAAATLYPSIDDSLETKGAIEVVHDTAREALRALNKEAP